ncbi:hypothetical protein [Desulfitobacterium metallireducens]|uniref:Flagellar protein FliT n=1 Tax=Desulfitobacterium metallireducens DSM 15288 TaxID=871968 RepID=W0EAL9_9FIRM|nr:hypothetical protein [Desulfitobacterium metallireducens]AHF07797.1 hypothetical protein DESME_12755 [Desulfitobacterium metallireducens DSM 15288]
MTNKTSQDLWQDYQFLTKEMIKFLNKPDMNLFYELMNQRERMQTLIDETQDKDYKATSEGNALLSQIQQDNQYIAKHLQLQINQGKHIHQVTEVYNGLGTDQTSRMTWKG